jgi:2-oxoglutarate dehydrogenase E1 component
MVIFTPKSLLRAPVAASLVEDLSEGTFEPVLDDTLALADPGRVDRILLSFGKIYYELLAASETLPGDGSERVALVRLEEIYPWPEDRLREIFASYANVKRIFWVQEEPQNMGAWTFVRDRLGELMPEGVALEFSGREPSASTATGSMRVHRTEQASLIESALEGLA